MKRLLISIPSRPNGAYANELSWWLTGIQVQSALLDFAEAIKTQTSDLAARLSMEGLARRFAVGWSLEQATLQWQDPKRIRDIGKCMIPDGWSIAMAPVFGSPIAAVRNEQVRRFLFTPNFDEKGTLAQTDFDAILFMDDDNVPGRHDLHVLCAAIERDDVDVVGGVYCMEAPDGPRPLVYKLEPDGKGFEYDTNTLTLEMGLHKLPGGGLPAGFLLVKRRVFERLWEARRTWFKDRLYDCSFEYHEIQALLMETKDDPAALHKRLWDMANERGTDWTLQTVGSWHIGEDIWFCRMCIEMGIDIWVDTRVFLKHIKKADNKQTFLRQQALGRRFFGHGVEAMEPGLSDERKSEIYTGFARKRANAGRHEEPDVAANGAAEEEAEEVSA